MPRNENKSLPWHWETSGQLLERPDPEPDVLSPLAKRVLTAARKALPPGTFRGPAFDDPEKCPAEIHQYQMWLAARLEASGLATWLAGGQAFLPDVADELSWPWNILAHLFAPRSYEQLTRKVVGNLAWYLDQSKPVRDPWKTASVMLLPSIYLAILALAVMYFTTGLQQASWIEFTGSGLALFAVFYLSLLLFGRNTHQHATNAAELYRYLAASYSEPRKADADAGETDWRELMGRLKPFTPGETEPRRFC